MPLSFKLSSVLKGKEHTHKSDNAYGYDADKINPPDTLPKNKMGGCNGNNGNNNGSRGNNLGLFHKSDVLVKIPNLIKYFSHNNSLSENVRRKWHRDKDLEHSIKILHFRTNGL